MAGWNGSGTFERAHDWTDDRDAGSPANIISATKMDAEFDNYKTGLEACLARNGETNPTAYLSWIRDHFYGADTGAADAYAIAPTHSPSAYAAGQMFHFIAANSNTGAATLDVNGLGAKAIKKLGSADLAANDIRANAAVSVIYDGSDFEMMSVKFPGWERPISASKTADYASTKDDVATIVSLDTTSGNVDLVLPLQSTLSNGFDIAAVKDVSASNECEIRLHATDGGAILIRLKALGDYARVRFDGADWHITETRIVPRLQIFTSTGTYTKSEGVKGVIAEIVGAGGGGAGAEATGAGEASGGSGGGGGGYARKVIVASALGATETVTIGSGGAGGIGFSNGFSGGATSFGSHCSATAGGGGQARGASSTVDNYMAGGAGGSGSGGDINAYGSPGGNGARNGTMGGASSAATMRGAGGSSVYGGGERGGTSNAPGAAGNTYGGGGSGAGNAASQSARDGGDGADGVVFVTEYF